MLKTASREEAPPKADPKKGDARKDGREGLKAAESGLGAAASLAGVR